FAGRNNLRLTGPAPIQVRLNIRFRQFHPGRATIDNDTHTPAVGFAPGRDTEQVAERIRHAQRLWEKVRAVNFPTALLLSIVPVKDTSRVLQHLDFGDVFHAKLLLLAGLDVRW